MNILSDHNLIVVLLLDSCTSHALAMTNTIFEHERVHLVTEHLRPKINYQLCIYIIKSATICFKQSCKEQGCQLLTIVQ